MQSRSHQSADRTVRVVYNTQSSGSGNTNNKVYVSKNKQQNFVCPKCNLHKYDCTKDECKTICFKCNKKGHGSRMCRVKKVHNVDDQMGHNQSNSIDSDYSVDTMSNSIDSDYSIDTMNFIEIESIVHEPLHSNYVKSEKPLIEG